MRNILILGFGVLKELIRRKDFYLILLLLVIILLYCAFLSFGGESGFQRYFKEIGITLSQIFSLIIAITFAARQIPQEVESKTIYPILAHPVSRMEFIIGKFFGVFLISISSFTIFYVVFIVSILMKGDYSTPPALLAEGYILHIFSLAFFVSLTILFSMLLSATVATAVSLILYCGTDWLGATFPNYILYPHPELFDIKEKIVHTWDIVPVWVMSFLTAYAVVYVAIFLLLAYLIFRNRNL